MQPQEARLAAMAKSGTASLTQQQRELAAVQDACRQVRGSDTACEAVQMGITQACDECLRRAGLKE
ncbi:MAG: hypothetical protein HOG89_05360 [Candidatus Peribacter sp.]|jgi:hypothetical protein|nr:hypothetical protein [Candidatus Peribacter sp.]MBT4393453.1 hypothetical protein [Candidatus Peribacter sp.]MBT4600564.1 hypothetical protein [Candidatus Peribacter sp.]MBT5149459.1 hypothetical protein [Candidatus Peribacter sp.]MBT5638589.1 hypothetical protein [Candidatus Peribacter sp.]